MNIRCRTAIPADFWRGRNGLNHNTFPDEETSDSLLLRLGDRFCSGRSEMLHHPPDSRRLDQVIAIFEMARPINVSPAWVIKNIIKRQFPLLVSSTSVSIEAAATKAYLRSASRTSPGTAA